MYKTLMLQSCQSSNSMRLSTAVLRIADHIPKKVNPFSQIFLPVDITYKQIRVKDVSTVKTNRINLGFY